MKKLSLFIAVLILTVFAFTPTVARADDGWDDLEVTMEVIDDASDLEETIAEMEGPGDDLVDDRRVGDSCQ